jgi:hypothetical protein
MSLLIELGVDIHHRNNTGCTPSLIARIKCDCWAEWCRALERNGLDIQYVLREDGEMHLAEESSENEYRPDEDNLNEDGKEASGDEVDPAKDCVEDDIGHENGSENENTAD